MATFEEFRKRKYEKSLSLHPAVPFDDFQPVISFSDFGTVSYLAVRSADNKILAKLEYDKKNSKADGPNAFLKFKDGLILMAGVIDNIILVLETNHFLPVTCTPELIGVSVVTGSIVCVPQLTVTF